MQVDTSMSLIAGLGSVWGTTAGGGLFALSSGTAQGGGFGPAALLSFGNPVADTSAAVYTQLAGLALQGRPTGPPPFSEQQAKREAEIIKRATALRVNGQYDEARQLFNDLLKENPGNAVAVHGLGAIELELGNYTAAEKLFRKAHYLDPSKGFDQDAENARILQRDDDYVLDKARRMVRHPYSRDAGTRLLVSLTRRSPANAAARVLLAQALIDGGDAINGLSQYQLAISTADRGQLQVIEAQLLGLLREAPEAAFVHNLLGQARLRLGKNEEAWEALNRAAELGNQDPLYLQDLALAEIALGRDAIARHDVNAALNHFREAERLDPLSDEVKKGMAEGYAARAEWRLRLGDIESAIDDYVLAANEIEDLDDSELRESIALGLYRAGLVLEARREREGGNVGREVAAFQQAHDLVPDNLTYTRKLAETRYTLGQQYEAEGKYKDAAYAYKAAYELRPYMSEYKQAAIDAFIAYGDERAAIYDHTAAIEAYDEAYQLNKLNETAKSKLAEAYNTRGLWYRSLGTSYYDEARADFYEALQLYPDNDEYQSNYDSVS